MIYVTEWNIFHVSVVDGIESLTKGNKYQSTFKSDHSKSVDDYLNFLHLPALIRFLIDYCWWCYATQDWVDLTEYNSIDLKSYLHAIENIDSTLDISK